MSARLPATVAATVVLAAVGGVVTPLGHAGGWQDPPVYRASRDVVRVELSVRRNQRPVSDLTRDEIRILDNGVPQRILDFGYERQLPIDVTVVLDVSESVSGATLTQLKRGVEAVKLGLTSRDRLKLVSFNSRVARLLPFEPPGAADLGRAFRGLSGAGNTSLYDAIAVALVAAADPDRRQLVVVFSDGEDTTSIVQPALLFDVARRTHAAVFMVMPFGRTPAGGQSVRFGLAHDTGGMVVSVSRDGSLPSTFRRVLDDFRQMYILHFTPTGVERRGFHTLDVSVTRQGQYDIRSRRGYTWSRVGP